jgi:hypothetical protein
MPVVLSMLAGAGAQFFDSNGNPLSGGLIYTYAAGTTTPQATFTSSTGLTAHANPIVLDAAGRVNQIWVDDALYYKFVLQTSLGVTIATYDNLYGPAAAERTIELDSGNNVSLPNDLTVAGALAITGALAVTGTTAFTGAVTAAAALTVGGDVTVAKAEPRVVLAKTATNQSTGIMGRNGGLPRWDLILGSGEAETGGNAGSRLALNRFSDAGAYIDTPLIMSRATGRLELTNAPVDPQDAATKAYVDGADNELRGGVSAVIATTSGTAHDVTGLPSWVNEVEVMFRGVSLNGSGAFLLQLGTSGGFVTTGYVCGSVTRFLDETNASGFLVSAGVTSGNLSHGVIRLVRQTGNIWMSTHVSLINTADGYSGFGAGSIDLGGTLTQVRFTRNISASFDAGDFVVRWRR